MFPEEIADEMVLADIFAEEIDAGGVILEGGGGQSVEVRATEHVAFANYAGRDCDGVDSGVEFCV